jgi:hypothetical protein
MVRRVVRRSAEPEIKITTEPYAEFWDASPRFKRIRDAAESSMVSRWGVLGTVMLNAVTNIPPNVEIEPVLDRPASLNLFAALVGKPGQGKGVTASVGRSLVPLDHDIEIYPLGTGQAIAHAYVEWVPKVKDEPAHFEQHAGKLNSSAQR